MCWSGYQYWSVLQCVRSCRSWALPVCPPQRRLPSWRGLGLRQAGYFWACGLSLSPHSRSWQASVHPSRWAGSIRVWIFPAYRQQSVHFRQPQQRIRLPVGFLWQSPDSVHCPPPAAGAPRGRKRSSHRCRSRALLLWWW